MTSSRPLTASALFVWRHESCALRDSAPWATVVLVKVSTRKTWDKAAPPVRLLGPRPDVPSVEEVGRAVRHLRNVQTLCFFEGLKGNDGFSMNLNFNASAYRGAGGRDFIEVAPRAATLHFQPKEIEGWNWAEALSALIRDTAEDEVQKFGSSASEGVTHGGTVRGEMSADGGLQLPLLAKGKVTAKGGMEASRSRSRGETTSSEVSRTQKTPWIEIMRPDAKTFELRLKSPPSDDLVRLNPELNRLSVLFAPEPGSLDPRDVKVSLSAQIKVDGHKVSHALRIRDVGGAWARLMETRNKQVIAEILVSKFLEPLHAPRRVWPRKGSATRG